MSKDAYWFRHDSNASRDLKMMQLKHKHDFWGIGVYWAVIEMLREQGNYCFNSDDNSLQMVSSLVNCSDTIRFFSWFQDCVIIGLFKVENGVFFSTSLIERMEKWEVKKDNGSKGGRPKKTEIKTEQKPKPKANRKHKIIEDKNIIKDKQKDFYDSIIPFVVKFGKEVCKEFYDYWSEPNKSKTKIRWELEETWDIERRLTRWESKNKDFGSPKTAVSNL